MRDIPPYLAHYGIKGMKWGRRRYQNKDGSLTAAGRKRYSQDYADTAPLRKKRAEQLSDADLKRLNKRMNLESEYKRLNPQGLDRYKKIAQEILSVAGTIGGLYAITKSPYAQAGRQWLESRL